MTDSNEHHTSLPFTAEKTTGANSEVPGEDALPIGSTLQNGALVLQHILSQSHFGITYRGLDLHLQRPVAVKEFFPDGCARHGSEVMPHGLVSAAAFQLARDRFLDEARTLARFRHPNIVHVYAFFEENNTAYMVMEYIEGVTLLEVVNQRGRLTEAEAVQYIVQAGEALEEVHRANLLHCDVKPENMILCGGAQEAATAIDHRRVVLVDFGLSTRLEERGKYLTRPLSETGNFGTPGYAPLEQYTQHVEFGIYTDVYALGATLYHLLTGHTPTPSADRAYGVDLVPPEQVHSDISHAASEAVLWAMQLRAELRPPGVRTWLTRLRASPVQVVHPPITVDEAWGTRTKTHLLSAPAPVTNALPAAGSGEPEEQGCLEATFAGCMALWGIALVIYLIGFLIHASMVAGR